MGGTGAGTEKETFANKTVCLTALLLDAHLQIPLQREEVEREKEE